MNVISGASFDGMRGGGAAPGIAIGPDHVFETVNGDYAIFDKSGVRISGPGSLASLWAGLGGACASGNREVKYDQAADRWLIAETGQGTECVAVSRTADPAGSYDVYSYGAGVRTGRLGVWPTATNSAYLAAYEGPAASSLCAYDRGAILAGAESPARLCFTGVQDAGLVAADVEGSIAPADGTPGYFANLHASRALGMYAMTLNFKDQAGSLGPLGLIGVDRFASPPAIPQPGTNAVLDSLGGRLMDRAAFRVFPDHESMVVTHAVGAAGVSAVRWYELRSPVSSTTAFTAYQQGTFAPADGNYRWAGTAATDRAGDIVLGYNAAASILYPSLRFTARTETDAPGTMEQESSVQEGVRAGDRGIETFAHIDPADDCTFWHVSGSAITRVGSFRLGSCGTAQTSPAAATKNPSSAKPGVMAESLIVRPKASAARPGNGAPSKVAIFRGGQHWLLDVDGNRQWDSPPDRSET